MNAPTKLPKVESDLPETPVIIPVEACISADYARRERDRLWGKVWQVACRAEEIPDVGDYITYDIVDQSVLVVRAAVDRIAAYHNVCMHRGRRLMKDCGSAVRLRCPFHGWSWNLDGENVLIPERENWKGALTPENTRLASVKCGTWGGYVFVNLNDDCEPLDEFLDPVSAWLDPFEIDKMRYRWRQWLYLPCNWKVAIESFVEAYHAPATHPQLMRFGDSGSWTRAHGKHGCIGAGRAGQDRAGAGTTGITANSKIDPRKHVAEFMQELLDTVNANTTQTIVDASKRLLDVLPPNSSADVAIGKMMELAAIADAERGVLWPNIDPQHFSESGIGWHVFPNSVILQGITYVLGYRARPNGLDPDSCIFEVFALERFPDGQEPKPENLFRPDISEENWRLVLTQDFSQVGEIQKGLHSKGFPGTRPSPVNEQTVINFHKNLADYMGVGAPERIG